LLSHPQAGGFDFAAENAKMINWSSRPGATGGVPDAMGDGFGLVMRHKNRNIRRA
jgi:hypothetical protein